VFAPGVDRTPDRKSAFSCSLCRQRPVFAPGEDRNDADNKANAVWVSKLLDRLGHCLLGAKDTQLWS
jgi:hypothetical protein